MAQVITFKRTHYYSIDNDIIDAYAPIIGAIGVAVYNVLCRHANRRTGECWPKHHTIAQTLSISVSAVKVYLKKLVKAGLIAIEQRWDPEGDPTSNRYTVIDRKSGAAPSTAAVVHTEPEGGWVTRKPTPRYQKPYPSGARKLQTI